MAPIPIRWLASIGGPPGASILIVCLHLAQPTIIIVQHSATRVFHLRARYLFEISDLMSDAMVHQTTA